MKNERIASIHDPRYREIIDNLAEARMASGISQTQLAESLGFNQSDISKIEGYERRVDILELLDIAKVICKGNDRQFSLLWKNIFKAYH